MQRATFWYTGLVGGGLALFGSLVIVAALAVHSMLPPSANAGATGAGANEAPDASASVSAPVEADPSAPAYEPRDPAAPPLAEGSTHELELVVTEVPMTVANGYVQAVWTFGESVPGPVLRVKVGDTVRVTLKNPETNAMPHSIDFHASMVAWNDEMRSINPGEELVYEFTANYAGSTCTTAGPRPRCCISPTGCSG